MILNQIKDIKTMLMLMLKAFLKLSEEAVVPKNKLVIS